jgi:hypothetical protein
MLRQLNPGDPLRMVMFKYAEDDDRVFVHVGKQSWSIPADTDITANIGFDGQFWDGSDKNRGRGNAFFVYIASRATANFLEAAAHANIMNISFGGNEPQWNVSMEGNRGATETFIKCAGQPRPRTSSQPFAMGGAQ